MNTTTKILAVSGVAFLGGASIYAYWLNGQFNKIMDSLKVRVLDIGNVGLKLSSISGDIKLQIINPTNGNLDLENTFVRAKELRIYDKHNNNLLVKTDLSKSKLTLPAYSQYNLPTMRVNISTLTIADTIIDNMSSDKTKFSDRLRVELDLRVFGRKKTFKFLM